MLINALYHTENTPLSFSFILHVAFCHVTTIDAIRSESEAAYNLNYEIERETLAAHCLEAKSMSLFHVRDSFGSSLVIPPESDVTSIIFYVEQIVRLVKKNQQVKPLTLPKLRRNSRCAIRMLY